MRPDIQILKDFSCFLTSWFWENLNMTDMVFVNDDDFYFSSTDKVIGYSLVMPPKSDEYFMEFCYSLGLKYELPCFMVSLFHEVGHYMTDFQTTYIQQQEYDKFVEQFQDVELTKENYLLYFNQKIEKRATLWGIRYINEHTDKIKALTQQCGEWIEKIYADPKAVKSLLEISQNF